MHHRENILVPFHYFVQPEPQNTAPDRSSLFSFTRLPIDVQLIIYEFCDAPTLFQLMRTCSRTRQPASQLFWDNDLASHWYYCHDFHLFEYNSDGFTFLRHCPEFAHRIRSVEIDLIRIELGFGKDDEGQHGQPPASTATKAKDFWIKVRKIFPSVKRIVLTGCEPCETGPPLPGDTDEDFVIIETVVQCAPAHIEVAIGFRSFPNRESDRTPRNTLWRAGNGKRSWNLLEADWEPTRVLLPGRRWPVSPLGDFLRFNGMYSSVILEMRGIVWLMIESYARYAVQDLIRCPRLDCSATYTERGSWKRHLYDSGHESFDIRLQSESDLMSQLFCYKHTPEVEKNAIQARHRRVDNLYLEAAKLQRRVGHGWGPPGSEQRMLFERQFTTQLAEEGFNAPKELDPDAMSAIEQGINNLHVWFNRNHVHHGCSGAEGGHVCYEG